MEDSKTFLKELINKFDNTAIKTELQASNEQYKSSVANFNSMKETLTDNINLFSRKNKQIESEIQRLQMIQSKNNEQYNKRNNERFKLAKKVIELEQSNEDLENQISALEEMINAKEEEINRINCPSSDTLYYEIVKGFGVEFVTAKENKGALLAKIKNKEKNDIFTVDVSEGSTMEVCDKIWNLL